MKKGLFFLWVVLFILGCSGKGGSHDSVLENENTVAAAKTVTAYFLDAPVEGLKYKTDGKYFYTGANGEFNCTEGHDVEFIVGNTVIGRSVKCSEGYITPLNLFDAKKDEIDKNKELVNTVVLLQSLDSDGEVNNGITITKFEDEKLAAVKIDLNDDESVKRAVSYVGKESVDADKALEHFTATLFGVESGKFSFDDSAYAQFVDTKISLLQSLADENISQAQTALKSIFTYYKNTLKTLNVYKGFLNTLVQGDVFDSDVLDNKLSADTGNLLKKLILMEIFDFDSENLDKALNLMNTGADEEIMINGTAADEDTKVFLKELNASIAQGEYNVTSVPSLGKYYDAELSGDEYDMAKIYLKFYYIAGDTESLIAGLNEFYGTDLKNEDEALALLADKYGYSGVDVNKIKNFTDSFIKRNELFVQNYSEFKESFAKVSDNLDYILDKKEFFFSDESGIPSLDVFNILTRAIKYNYAVEGAKTSYGDFVYKNNIVQKSDVSEFSENVLSFDVSDAGEVYALGSYGNVYLNGKALLNDPLAEDLKVSDGKIYLLKKNGEIDVYEADKKLYTLSSGHVYNKFTVIDGYVYALRTDGKTDIFENEDLAATLGDSNSLVYVDMWISDTYAVFATNDGKIAVYRVDGPSSLSFEGYYAVNPVFASLSGEKLFVYQNGKIYSINLSDKKITTVFELDNIQSYLSEFPSSAFYLSYDAAKKLLFAYNGGDLLEFAVKDDGSVVFTNYISIAAGGWDVSEFFNPKTIEKNGKIYFSLYGSSVVLNIPEKPLLNMKANVLDTALTVSENVNRYAVSGMSQKVNRAAGVSVFNGRYYPFLIVPVSNGANGGVYIIKPYSGVIGYLNIPNPSLLPDINSVWAADGYISVSNSVDVSVYKLDDVSAAVSYENSFVYPYITSQNDPVFDGVLNPVGNILMRAVYTNGKLALFSSNMLQILTYDFNTGVTQVAPAYSLVLGSVPYRVLVNGNDVYVVNSCDTPYGCINGGEGTFKFSSLFDEGTVLDEDYGSSLKTLPTLLKIFDTVAFTASDSSAPYSVIDTNGALIKSTSQNYEDVEKVGDFYLLLNKNGLTVLNETFENVGNFDVNVTAGALKILRTGVYAINDANITVLDIDRNVNVDLNFTARGWVSWGHYTIEMNSTNKDSIAKISVETDFPYKISITDGNDVFEIKDGVLKTKDNAVLSDIVYNVTLYAQNALGGEDTTGVTIYNTDEFLPENASETYNVSFKFFEHDVLPVASLSSASVMFPVIRGEDADYFKIEGGTVYFKQPPSISDKQTYHIHVLAFYNYKLVDFNETINLIDTNDSYVFGVDTITDTKNNIMWQRSPAAQPVYTYDEAESICENATTGGYTDWRLPTSDELKLIYDPENYLQPGFNYSGPPTTWSQTACDDGVEMLDFANGEIYCRSLDQSDMDPKPNNDVRCVRDVE